MTKQRAITSRDHGACVLEEGFDGVSRGGCLPIVAVERAKSEDDLRYILLRGASAMTVECLQHPAQARAPLLREAGIGRYRTAMQSGEQTGDGLKPVEAFDAERYECAERFGPARSGAVHQPHTLAISEIENRIGLAVSVDADCGGDRWVLVSAGEQNTGQGAENDGAGVVLGKPNRVRFGRIQQRVHGEIVIPTAVLSF
ncbi:hypothetical protein BN961_03862 [Afipia felis]|uniref:Uncharacterized protein n=1 Tax=Afipia felis TaxID=1035 RepID=A0A090MVB5_AFIFE|nr:hypothetical protein BN961_03862 [Afipia felis]